jgi:hypothetical protein
VYDYRNKLECDPHKELLKRDQIEPLLNAMEDWLYR